MQLLIHIYFGPCNKRALKYTHDCQLITSDFKKSYQKRISHDVVAETKIAPSSVVNTVVGFSHKLICVAVGFSQKVDCHPQNLAIAAAAATTATKRQSTPVHLWPLAAVVEPAQSSLQRFCHVTEQ
jgi:hypothetical protein